MCWRRGVVEELVMVAGLAGTLMKMYGRSGAGQGGLKALQMDDGTPSGLMGCSLLAPPPLFLPSFFHTFSLAFVIFFVSRFPFLSFFFLFFFRFYLYFPFAIFG